MRTALPILLVVVLVFGATVISQFSLSPPKVEDDPTVGGSSAPAGPPVEFPTTRMAFDPTPGDANTDALGHAAKRFAGFFELGSEANLVPFHFRTNWTEPVKLSALQPSCTKCTSARGATLPPAAMDKYLAAAAFGPLWGPIPGPDVLTAVAWAEVYKDLKWHRFDFAKPYDMLTIPPATNGRPTTGLLELAFKVNAVGEPSPVFASFDAYRADNVKIQQEPFVLAVAFAGREPFELYPGALPVGELPEGTPSKSFEVTLFSAVREQADFPPPTLGPAVPDPYISVGPPTPITPEEMAMISRAAITAYKYPLRVKAGYKFQVELRREANGQSLDIGKFEKELFAASSTTQKTYRLQVTGTVTGLVKLDGGAGKIDFGSYNADYEAKKVTRLLSDKPGLELELIPGESEPRWVTYTIGPPERDGNRTAWAVQAHIKAKDGRYPPWEKTLTLRTNGPNPTYIRIPVTGHGR